MSQRRLIRYLEDGVYKYASVKDVGDLELLRTKEKADLVSAINELVVKGDATSIDLGGKIQELEEGMSESDKKLLEQGGVIDAVLTEYELSKEDIKLLQEIQQEVKDATVEALQKADNLKAQTDQIIVDLATKVSDLDYQEQYTKVKDDLMKKVDQEKYQGEYDALVLEIGNKVGSIEYKSKIDELNASIASQGTDIAKAKSDITAVDTKLTNAKSELNKTISDLDAKAVAIQVESNEQIVELDAKVAQQKSDLTGVIQTLDTKVDQQKLALDGQISTVATTAQGNLNTAKQELNTAISNVDAKVTQNEDDIAETLLELDSVKTDLQGKIDTANGSITTVSRDVDTVKGQLSTTITNLSTVDGKVAQAQTAIAQNATDIKSKASQTSLDTLSGTVTSQGTLISQNATAIGLRAEKKDVYTKTEADGKITGAVNSAKAEIKLTTDGISQTVSNTNSRIDGIDDAIEDVNLSISNVDQKADSISQTVSSLNTTVTDQGKVITSQGTSITSLTDAIGLKAEKTNVYTKVEADGKISGAVATAKADIKLTTDGITQRVTATEGKINTATGDITTLKTDVSTLEQTADQIQTTVSGIATNVSGIDGRLSTAETQVTQNKTNINLKANSADVYTKTQVNTELGKKVDTSTYNTKMSQIDVTTSGISQSVSDIQSSVEEVQDDIGGIETSITTMNSNISSIDQKADSIALNVGSLQSTVTAQGETITSQGTSITSLNTSIGLKAEKKDVYTKTETDGKVTSAVNTAKSEIKVTTDGITQTVSNLSGTVSGQGTRLTNAETTIGQHTTSINLKANAVDVYTKAQVNTELGKKVNTSTYDTKMAEIAVTTSGITQTVSDLQTDLTTVEDGLGTVEESITTINSNVSAIDQKANSIQLSVGSLQTTVDSQGQKITDQGTSITAMNTAIGLKAEKKDVYTKTEADGKISGAVNTAKSEIKLTTDGISQTVTNLSGKVTGVEGSVSTLSSNISAVDQKADGIKTTVTSLTNTVSGQDTRLKSAETTIDQHTTSINLKANATDVYTKTQVNTELGKKVDTTTYNNKTSAIDVSINGINQTVQNQKTSIDNLTGNVTTHTSQISTLDQRANGFDLKVTELTNGISGLNGRVGSAETQITANKDAIALKANQTSLNTLDGRVTTAEGQLTVQAGQIASRVTKTDFDGAVGLNKWVASKYLITGTDLSTTIPTFALLKEKQASEVKDIIDSATPAVFSGTGVVTHLFTNIFLQTAKTISLSVKYDNSIGVYVNGAKIYENKSNAQALVPVSMSLRAGWNTVEILHGLKTGTPVLNLGTTLSTQVDKMTAVIGVGDKNETRLTQAETAITQTEKSIELKADNTVVTAIGNRVTSTEGSISVLNTQIQSKVSQTNFDAYAQRVTNAESTITQLSGQITQKVNKTDYDNLNNRVGTAESTITQLSSDIALRVTKTDFDGLKGRVSSAETQITANKDAIALKANQTSLDNVSGRLTTAEGSITVLSNSITSKVAQTDFDTLTSNVGNLENRISSSETAITQSNTAINLKANKTDVYTKTETNTELGKKANQTDVTAVTNSVNDMASDMKVTPLEKSTLKTNWERIKAEYAQVLANAQVSTVAVSTTAFTNAYNAIINTTPKIDAEVLASMTTTYTFASATARDTFRTQFNTYFVELEKIRKAINDKVNSTANTAKGTADTANATANTLRDTTIPSLVTRISTAESEIDQTTEQIALRVTKAEFDALGVGGRNLVLNSPVLDNKYSVLGNYKGNRTVVDDTGALSGKHVKFECTTAGTGFHIPIFSKKPEMVGKTFTWSFYAKANVPLTGKTGHEAGGQTNISVTTDWKKYEYTWVMTEYTYTSFTFYWNFVVGDTLYIRDMKIEEGSKSTTWTPAPEDVSAETAQAVSQAKSEIKVTTDGITQSVNNLSSTVNTQGQTISNQQTAINQMNGKIDLKAEITTVNTVSGVANSAKSTADTANATANTVKGVVSNFDSSMINANPIFLDWSGTYPVGYGSATLGTGCLMNKVASGNGMGNALKFTVTAGQSAYLNPSTIASVPFAQYVTIEITFMLQSGTIDGAGILFRYMNTSNGILQDHKIHLKDFISSPVAGKWYTVTKMIKQTNSTNFLGYQVFPMGGWSSFGTVTDKVVQFDSVKTRASSEQEINAYESNILIADMATDGKIVPMEKQQLKKEWASISAEKPSYESLANTYGITTEKTNYVNAYNTLNTDVTAILASMNTTSTIDATAFRAKFDDYYDKKALLIKKTNETSRTLANNAQGTANTANSTANTLRDTTIPAVVSRVSTAESNISIQAGQIASKVGSTEVNQTVNGAINNLKLSSRNLILQSDIPYDTTSYLVKELDLAEDFIAGEEYTFVIKGSIPSTQKFGLWQNSGNSFVGHATSVFSNGVYYVTFKAVATVAGKERKLSLYNTPSNSTQAIVDWVGLYKGNKPMDWTPANEDFLNPLAELNVRMKSAEQLISEDSIVATVTKSESFATALEPFALTETVDGVNNALADLDSGIDGRIKGQIDSIDLETYQVFSDLKQTASDVQMNFTSAGGVNLVKNSVGFAGFDFWAKTGTLEIRQNEGLDVLGFGSGFFAEKGKNGTATQIVPVTPLKEHTITIYLDKSVDNATSGYAGIDIYDGTSTKLRFMGLASGQGVTKGYEAFSYTFTPKNAQAKIVLSFGTNAEATITGIMLNIGNKPLQWTMAHGEIYNTNVRFDMKGIKVSKIEDDKETKFTVMTPDKFAGYFDVNGDGVIDSNDGSADEVFKMDEDSFVMKKAVMKEEISMGTLKALNINTSTNKGWAFIPSDS